MNELPRKPNWLNKKIDLTQCREVDLLLKDLRLNTICQQALCPNIAECFHQKVATFLVLGKTCTRNCGFCAVTTGLPQPVDYDEPSRIVKAVERLGLRHVVITSVTRDDLADGGASVFAEVIRAIRSFDAGIAVEVLVPDFKGYVEPIRDVVAEKPSIFAHNVETVPRLYGEVRPGASYERSISVLRIAKQIDPAVHTKSGIMVGLGEGEQEVFEVLQGLRGAGCDFISIGQYLVPGGRHCEVKEYVTPDQFARYKQYALRFGFLHVESAPYVRSSYRAAQYL